LPSGDAQAVMPLQLQSKIFSIAQLKIEGSVAWFEKMVSTDDLLERVTDKQTFIEFVQALADERERAQEIENNHLNVYIVDGALEWKNGDIHSFLYAALECFAVQSVTYLERDPSWKMFAEFRYFGKIYE
jgi:hypothetical protein